MCGILGFYNLDNNLDSKSVVQRLSYRGRDGYGYYVKKNEKSEIVKSTNNIETFSQFYLHSGLYIFNSRAIPTTEWETGAGHDIKNQQPFEDERFVVVFNGIIANDKELIDEYNLKTVSKVDTAILPPLFSKVGIISSLKKLKGSYAILCYDKFTNKFYAAKNFMPLRIWNSRNGFVFVSLKEMIEEIETKEVEPYTCYEISLSENCKVKKHSLYPKQRNKRVLIICSGGIDSVTTAFLYKYLGYEIELIHFTYGQAAQKAELYAIRKFGEILGVEPVIYKANSIFKPFQEVSKLLNQKEAKEEDKMLDAESVYSYVPNRNAIFANIAAGVAEMMNCDTVTFGGQQSDAAYPDNNPGFVESIDKSLKYSLNWYTNIKFTAPLIHLIKHEVVELGQKIGVPYEYICSCYYPKIRNGKIIHCEKCGCCQYKSAAFKMVEERQTITDVNEFIDKYVKKYM